MKKVKSTLLFSALFSVAGLLSVPAQAASQDECAIWLCLPAGFPGGCAAAHKAFLKRIHRGKSPLPAFAECADDEKGMTYSETNVIKIAEHRECVSSVDTKNGTRCVKYETIPAHYEKGNSCRIGSTKDGNEIPYCIGAYSEIAVHDENGKVIGEPYRQSK